MKQNDDFTPDIEILQIPGCIKQQNHEKFGSELSTDDLEKKQRVSNGQVKLAENWSVIDFERNCVKSCKN